jgi:tetratricopeptide (TPR) repeat protein
MLFDLKGKRRRVVQGTYLMLAILLGAGLVLFGIGSSTSGGLGDLFSGGGGSNKGNSVVQKKIDAADKQLQVNPRNVAALGDVIRGHYQLATANADPNTGAFAKDARGDLQQAADAWQRYVATNPKKIDVGLARVMVQAYSGLAQLSTGAQATATRYWAGASEATELIAAQQPNPANYIALVQYATLAGQTNKADLAGNKAISLAPKAQRKAVQQQVASAKAAGSSQPGGAGAPAPSGTAP